jgi:hypothetical protein
MRHVQRRDSQPHVERLQCRQLIRHIRRAASRIHIHFVKRNERLPTQPASRVAELLPHRWSAQSTT